MAGVVWIVPGQLVSIGDGGGWASVGIVFLFHASCSIACEEVDVPMEGSWFLFPWCVDLQDESHGSSTPWTRCSVGDADGGQPRGRPTGMALEGSVLPLVSSVLLLLHGISQHDPLVFLPIPCLGVGFLPFVHAVVSQVQVGRPPFPPSPPHPNAVEGGNMAPGRV
eukprot:scaffold694_cov338-Pavlova_lutheri.AAC.47